MALTLDLKRPKFNSGRVDVRSYPEASGTQTFKAGAFVTLNTSGQVLVAPSNAIYVFGMALEDASGTENTKLLILLAHEDTYFEACYTTSGAAVATAQTIVGDTGCLNLDSTYLWHTIDTATTACCKIYDLKKTDSVGDLGGRVIFKFYDATNQTMTAAADDDGV